MTARLANAIGRVPPRSRAPRAPLDWDRWLQLARDNDLAPLLHARPSTAHEPWPDAIRDELQRDYARWGHAATFRMAALATLLRALARRAGAVVLKGAALAVTLYDEAAERVMSDIDLLFADEEARETAVVVLAEHGFVERRKRVPASHDLEVRSPSHSLSLDLHVNLCHPFLPRAAMADAFEHRVATAALGGYMVMLDPVWRALHSALHALGDPIDSPLLRNLFEAGWQVMRLDDRERALLAARAQRFGIADRVARALGLAHQLFGTPAVLGTPWPGPLEFWAWRRLSTIHGDPQRTARFVQTVGEQHTRFLREGAGPWDSRPLFSAIGATVARAATVRFEQAIGWVRSRRALRPLRRATAAGREIGHGVLLRMEVGGDVHLLKGVAAAAWRLAYAESTVEQLVARLVLNGAAEEQAREAIAALRQRRLLT